MDRQAQRRGAGSPAGRTGVWRIAAIWLLPAAAALQLRCAGRVGGPRTAAIQQAPIIRVRLTSGAVRQAALSSTGAFRLKADGAVLAESGGPLAETPVARSGRSWTIGSLKTSAGEIILEPLLGGFIRLGDVAYRGTLRLLPAGDDQFIIINQVELDSYLAGVLSRELYPAWDMQTYLAQAVVARTFALYHMVTSGTENQYDVGDDQSSQVYGGLTAETERAWAAVRETYGIVLAYGPPGNERIFMTQYSSCCGGRVNGAYAIRNAPEVQPLMGGQLCSDCSASPRFRWPRVAIPKSQVYQAIVRRYPAAASLGSLIDIRVASTTDYGRAVRVDAVGPRDAKVRLRAEDVRLALIASGLPAAKRLYSMNCQFRAVGDAIEFSDGRGHGHGVGLCQWGAQGKAEKGWKAEQILAFYYPGAKFFRAY